MDLTEMAAIFRMHDREKNRVHSYVDMGTLVLLSESEEDETEDDAEDEVEADGEAEINF